MTNSLAKPPSVTLALPGGVRIVVPDSLDLITPYVLREQEDWFEDEIRFLRRLLQPGQEVIDVGANYGVYTLSMARVVGPGGRVWAFEPASETAALLAESVAANGFTQVILDRRALSRASGVAQLALDANSELNALVHAPSAGGAAETVSLTTLDLCLEAHAWQDIEFVKIDAEGEEANIIEGGKRFFAELSPLVQYEVKAGADLHMELVEAFASLGYDSYRLVPGLDMLAPFEGDSPPDGYLLNLFCCKRDRASRLAARGVLVDGPGLVAGRQSLEEITKGGASEAYGWNRSLVAFPYGARLAPAWRAAMDGPGHEGIAEALRHHAMSRDAGLPAAVRFAALEASLDGLTRLCARQPAHLRLSSLARVAREFGARDEAVNALALLTSTLFNERRADPGEPFLAPGERFDSLPPGEAMGNWVLAAVLEEGERLGAFSSYFTGMSTLGRLEMIRDLGFGSGEMQRRFDLLRQREAAGKH